MSTHLSKAEYQLLAAFRYALRRFLHFSEDAARAAGVEPQQHQALLAIKGFPERERVTIGELAERLQIKHHTAVELAGRLAANGLALREPAAADRRQVYLALTPHGEAVLEQLTAAHRQELRRMGPELRALLGRLSDAEDAGSGSAGD
jgi:DNA-binding MarR family transcriptional regulator